MFFVVIFDVFVKIDHEFFVNESVVFLLFKNFLIAAKTWFCCNSLCFLLKLFVSFVAK